MAHSGFLDELKHESRRRESVLVFRGTGFNIWHYFPFLTQFSLEELAQFRAIYGISGASLLLWLYCLLEQKLVPPSVAARYDAAMRHGLNRDSWIPRTFRLLSGRYPYWAEDFLKVFQRLAPSPACDQTFAQLPLPRLKIVAEDRFRQQLLILDAEQFPAFSIGEVISRAATWGNIFGRPFCHRTPYHGLLIGDFDFSGKPVRGQFRDHLRTRHPEAQIYQVNLFRTLRRGPEQFVRICYDRLPRAWQLIDFSMFYFGIPNSRYRRTASRQWNGSNP